MRARVAVVGGGISGLAAAWELARARPRLAVTLFEGAAHVGGKLRLADVAGHPVDVGAESILARRPEALTLLGELGLAGDIVHPAPVGASIVSRGQRWPMPKGTLMGVPSDPESVRGLLTDEEVDRLVAEATSPPAHLDVPVGAFVERRLGAAVTDKLVEPLLAGVYAGHSRHLSLEMSVPALYRAAVDGSSVLAAARAAAATAAHGPAAGTPVFASLRSGVGSLPIALAHRLATAGVRICIERIVRVLKPASLGWMLVIGPTIDETEETFDAVILATPAAPTARLLRAVAPESAAALSRIEYASMAIITIALVGPADAIADLSGSSGFLVPPTEPLTIKASTFSSTKWPALQRRCPDLTYLRASIGRHREEATLQRSDDELGAPALADLATVLGHALPDPVAVHVQRWGGGLPQYAVGHRSLVDAVRAGLPPGLAAAGAAYDGVGIPACIASGRAAARAVLSHLVHPPA